MTEDTGTAYYSFSCAGQNLCIAALDILFLGAVEDIEIIQDISTIKYAERHYPVYSFREGFIPQPGAQPDDSRCLLLHIKPEIGDIATLGLACGSVFKMQSKEKLHSLPEFMVGTGPIQGLLRKEDSWVCVTSAQTVINYFERALSYELPTRQQNVRMAG